MRSGGGEGRGPPAAFSTSKSFRQVRKDPAGDVLRVQRNLSVKGEGLRAK